MLALVLAISNAFVGDSTTAVHVVYRSVDRGPLGTRLGASPVPPPLELEVCIVPATVQIRETDSCATLAAIASSSIDVAGLSGERESVQILLRTSASLLLTKVDLQLDGVRDATVRQVGYVNTSATSRYSPSGGGWRPDPLLPLLRAGTRVLPGVASSLWLSVTLDGGASGDTGTTAAGRVMLTFHASSTSVASARDATVAVAARATVWGGGLSLPSALEVHRDFGELWSFEAGDLETLYGAAYTNETLERFQSMSTAALLPPDHLYRRVPADEAHYEYLARTGAYLLNLANVGTDARGCPTPADVAAALEMLAPAVEAIGRLDPSRNATRPYVYGYDEQPPTCEANIRALFGAIKARWPHVATAAALNWGEHMPTDMPIDIWVVQYEKTAASAVQAWQAAGKQLFLYHCIEPSGAAYLNTFIERPRVQVRHAMPRRMDDNWLLRGWHLDATPQRARCGGAPADTRRPRVPLRRPPPARDQGCGGGRRRATHSPARALTHGPHGRRAAPRADAPDDCGVGHRVAPSAR